jgi:hypothetical protein
MIEARQSKISPTTEAAAGVPRLRWTLVEFERMAQLGFFAEDERIELVGGELVPMAPESVRHETMSGELLSRMRRRLPEITMVAAALATVAPDETLTARLIPSLGPRLADLWFP